MLQMQMPHWSPVRHRLLCAATRVSSFLYSNAQFVQLLLARLGRRAHHDIPRIAGLREGDHLAGVGPSRGQHADAVNSGGESAVGRCAVFESLEHVPKSLIDFLIGKPKQLENFILQFSLMNPDTAE